MDKGLIKFKVSELVKFRDGIISREKALSDSLKCLTNAKRSINKILSEFKEGDKDGIIFLPKNEFEKIKTNSTNIKTNFNWKKITIEVITNANSFLSTSELYIKAKIKYPIELADKVKSIRGFSSALNYLISEKKIIRIVENKKYLYGIEKK